MEYTQTDLEQATRHVVDAEARVVEQQARIARLKRHGHATERAEELLSVLQRALALKKTHLESLTSPLGHDDSG
jgi:hypothetical protein